MREIKIDYKMEHVIKVLNRVKNECQRHEDCKECPFIVDQDCAIHDYPEKWIPEEIKKEGD